MRKNRTAKQVERFHATSVARGLYPHDDRGTVRVRMKIDLVVECKVKLHIDGMASERMKPDLMIHTSNKHTRDENKGAPLDV